MPKKFKILLLITAFAFLQQKGKSQCINAMASYTFDCLTSSAVASITIGSPSGVPPYTFTWVPIGVYTQSVANLGVGTYTIYFKDAANCMYSTVLQIVMPYSSSNIAFSSTMVTCNGGSNGAAQAMFNGAATPPFTYTWTSNGSSFSSANTVYNLTAGNYVVTVKDSKGCGASNTVTITEPAAIGTSASPTAIVCHGGTVQAALTTTGGVSPFTYTVSGASVSGNTATLTAGLYTLVTTDSKGCVKSNTVNITQPPPNTATFSIDKPACPGKSDGTVTAGVTGGPAGPYSYTWLPQGATGFTHNNIPAGTYTLVVAAGNGCLTRSAVAVSAHPAISGLALTKSENCSAVDGAFTLSLSGGHPPFSFTTQPGAYSGSVVTNISSGNYTTVITDTRSCADTIHVVVGNLSTVSVSLVKPSAPLCYNLCNGSFSVHVQNAVQPVTYSVTGTPTTGNSFFKDLCPGLYYIRAIDAIGCPATTTINFASPVPFSYSVSTPSPVCFGKPVKLDAFASGGLGMFTYLWNPGNHTTKQITVTPPSTTVYSLNVFDHNGCTLPPYQVTVTVFSPISIQIHSSSSGICPGSTAQITPTVSGGDGNYRYTWQPGGFTSPSIFVESIEIPEYTLMVTDGCATEPAVKLIPVKLFPVIIPTFESTGEGGCSPYCARFVNTTPSSREPVWNFGDGPYEQPGDTAYYCYRKEGAYNLRLTVTDMNKCRTSHSYTGAIKVLARPRPSFKTFPELLTLNNSEEVKFRNTSSSASDFTWYLSNKILSREMEFTMPFTDTGCTDITLVARNAVGCQDSVTQSVCVFEGFNFYMPSAFTPNNDGLNDVLVPKGTGWLFSDYLLEVYNRWGRLVFRSTDPQVGWDGGNKETFDNSGAYTNDPNDIYVWRVLLTDNQRQKHSLSGSVSVTK